MSRASKVVAMLIRPQTAAPPQASALQPLAHGGELDAARRMFPGAPEPFIDLSTGINPRPYPLPVLPAEIFARLPDRAGIRALAAVAAEAYGAPSADHVAPAPGTQILLPHVACPRCPPKSSPGCPTAPASGRWP